MGLVEIPQQFDTTDWYVKTEPANEPVTLAELKAFIKLDGSSEDAWLESLIKASRKAVEAHLGRALITQTIVLRMDSWPSDVLELPRPPLQSVTEVRTLDEDDAATVYDASNYFEVVGERAQLVVREGCSLPYNDTGRSVAGYEVEYVAGYGDSADSVPEAIRMAIMQWAAAVYENRVTDFSNPPATVLAVLGGPYKRIRV